MKLYHFDKLFNEGLEIPVTDRENNMTVHTLKSDYFALFIENLVKFFDTGIVPVPHQQTVNVVATIDAGRRAAEKPFEWVEI